MVKSLYTLWLSSGYNDLLNSENLKVVFYCVKYPYLILTSAFALAGANTTTKREYLKRNILFGTSMNTHDRACALIGNPFNPHFNFGCQGANIVCLLCCIRLENSKRWLKARLKRKDRGLLRVVAILLLNGTPIIFAGLVETKRREMMYVSPRKRRIATFVFSFRQNRRKS